MDLRGMLNDNGPAAAAAAASSGKPLPPQHIQIQTQQPPSQPPLHLPSTPVQTLPQQPFRDYGQTQQSPLRQYSQDFGAQNAPPPSAYASSPYQSGGGPGQYPNRPQQPPPLQQIAPNDLRSPSLGSGPAPSPYRPTPTSSISTASGGYPFPPPQQTPTSPVQRHQYPPTSAFHREGYPQPSGAMGMTGPPGASSYMQGAPMPQTPPIGPPGGAHPYPHQRSQSSQSTPTPTSAQSQSGQYGASYVHGSPVATAHQLPQMEHPQRQSSQPPTPIAGPLSGPRAGQTLNFPQPPSPYQHRLQSTPAYHPLPSHSSPPPPPPPSLPRHPSSQSVYESQVQDIAPRRPQSHSERDRSVSISPKTRVPSLPSSTGRPATSVSESEARHPKNLNLPPSALGPPMDVDRERDQLMTPAKRKLEDRELRSDELERRETRPPPFQDVADRSVKAESTNHTPVPAKRPERKMVHKTVPIWAQTAQGRQLAKPNSVIYKPSAHHTHQVNGKSESLVSRHTSPEERRSTVAPQAAPPAQPSAQPPPRQVAEPPLVDSLLGHFEPSITGEPHRSSLLNRLCDFFFATVVKNENMDEMQSRGVKFEIEAKFGILIDRGTNNRINLPVETDCILTDGNWFAFRSSMTEAQHKGFNDFLNEMVMAAHPDNKANIGRPPRLPLKYQHRREVDKFFDLPENINLPEYVASLLQASGHRPKLRVTYDQKTNDVLAKIIKARVHDIHLFLPQSTLDCRISVNLEMDWEGPVEALASQTKRAPAPDRNKDRLSYSHGLYQVDLTQVTQVNAQRPEKQHELEIEVNPAAIVDQGQRAAAGQPNMYIDLIGGFLNNIVLLARKA
ncbi:CYTH-like domain containing protein [Naviculisporaceae sp. PSN 640]